MPTSHYRQINEIVELISHARPRSVLDVGIGCGKYGFLCREYLELSDGREKYNDWRLQVDGVEGHAEYVTDLQRIIYSNIFIGNATEILPTLSTTYDLLLLIDVLEHFDRTPGVEFLHDCKKRAKNMIISTPLMVAEQGDVFGNELERHKAQWTRNDLAPFGPVFFVRNPESLLAFIGPDAHRVKRDWYTDRRRNLVNRYCPWAKRPYALLKKLVVGR